MGEDSARFVREEMERTWGEKHMAMLSEDKSQMWILGLSYLPLSFLYGRPLDPPQWRYPMLLHPCSPLMHLLMALQLFLLSAELEGKVGGFPAFVYCYCWNRLQEIMEAADFVFRQGIRPRSF